jgi:hypothetical protein
MARSYHQALGSLFVASYDSQGYGRDIQPRLHMGYSSRPYGSRGRTQQKTPFLTAAMLGYDVAVMTDTQKTLLPGIALSFCDVPAVAETRLLRHCPITCLSFQ